MRSRLLKPLALFVALSFAGGSATAAIGVRTCAYHSAPHAVAGAEAPADEHSGHEAASHGHSGHEAASHHESSPDGDNHSSGCDCLGRCLGGAAPPALTETSDLRVPLVATSTGEHDSTVSRPDRVQPPFLLPFANAPPAVS